MCHDARHRRDPRSAPRRARSTYRRRRTRPRRRRRRSRHDAPTGLLRRRRSIQSMDQHRLHLRRTVNNLSVSPYRPLISAHSHLAEIWSTVFLPPHPKRRLLSSSTPVTQLSTIEHLVLLDLLGAANPHVRSYFPDTAWLFDALVDAETRLRTAGLIDATALGDSFFNPRSAADHSLGYMGDDHIPFLHRGVSILHVITEPFPRVWHTLAVRASLLPPFVSPC
jgi:hypothetical protein